MKTPDLGPTTLENIAAAARRCNLALEPIPEEIRARMDALLDEANRLPVGHPERMALESVAVHLLKFRVIEVH